MGKSNTMKKMIITIMVAAFALVLGACGAGNQPADGRGSGPLNFKDGMAQPMLTYSSADVANAESDIQRFCVYVETDHDTDGDGKADLVKAFVQVPKAALVGGYDAAVIYDPTPYPAGYILHSNGSASYPYAKKSFDYKKLYEPGKKRKPSKETTGILAAAKADPSEWSYTPPDMEGEKGYYNAGLYDYFLIRGFAVVEACGIGTFGSEGYELCGTDLERDSHKCVIEWLTGKRVAYTDTKNNIAIKADWCNGNVAMTGTSYGGTLPFEVATTGVEGLKTIIPIAGISNWYDYTNSQGVSIYSIPHYTDYLAAFNAGASFLDDDWTVTDDQYGAWLKQIAADETKANGNFTGTWKERDYSNDTDKINCTALIVHGLNDFNVLTKQADLMYKAFKEAGQDVKILFHQDGHRHFYGKMVDEELYEELMNKWLSHYLYGVDNGIEKMAPVTVQSNVDGSFKTYDSWGEAGEVLKAKPLQKSHAKAAGFKGSAAGRTGTTVIRNGKYDDFFNNYLSQGADPEQFFKDLNEEHAAVFTLDVPEETTIYGVPAVHLKLSTSDVDQDNRMVSAVLLDTAKNGKTFKVYKVKKSLSYTVPKKSLEGFEYGGGHDPGRIKEFVQSPATAKLFSKGWMDLMDPDAGYISSEQPKKQKLNSNQYYDYTLYLTPTVYKVRKGHQLQLVVLAQDPYRSRNNDYEDGTPEFNDNVTEPVYSFTIDNSSVKVDIPVTKD